MPVLLLLLAILAPALWAGSDRVVRRDGTVVTGKVVRFDGEEVVVDTDRRRITLPRAEVASIEFAKPDAPPLDIKIRSAHADDSAEIYLEDELLIRGGRSVGGWVDLGPKLKDGNNSLRLRIQNKRGVWGYDLSVKINGKLQTIRCGSPGDSREGCTCCGYHGKELGTIDLEPIWIYVDRELGLVEVEGP
ncbi:hypothetical protein ABI59_05725 [Acidobacteria bacterium Mor1]|nr:hypothetical protein ABI59_05725 [Acidobacteria bacterium Mor1]